MLRAATTAANTNNTVATNSLSQQELSALMASFVAMPNTTGSGSSDAVNIDTYVPDFKLSESKDYNKYFANVPADQYAFQAYSFSTTNKKIFASTPRNNVGSEINYYLGDGTGNLKLIYTITPTQRINRVTGATVTKTSQHGTFTTNQTIANSEYKGGTYNYTVQQDSTVNFPGIGIVKLSWFHITDGNGNSPVDNGDSAIVTDNAHRLYMTWNNGELQGNTSPDTLWNSGGANIPTKVTQNIWYVDAKTGQVLSHKVSAPEFSGASYDSTNNGFETITHDGKTYKLVARNANGTYDASDFSNILGKQLETNNGIPITVGDVLSTPLKGTLGHGRIGYVRIGGTNYQGQRAYIVQQLKTDGTSTANTYTFDPGSSKGNLNTGLSKAVAAPGETISGAGDTGGGGGQFTIGKTPANRDLIFLYNPETNKQNATITFVDDDNGSSLSTAQNATGDANTQITFDNAASTVNNILGQGYTYIQTTGTGVTGGNTGSFTGVSFPAYDSDDNTTQSFVVHFKKTPAATTYKQGKEETHVVHRTINYYDKLTGAKIPSDYIPANTNPTNDSVTFTRTQVLDQNNKVVGYGTVSSDGTSFRTQDWHDQYGETSTQFNAKKSPDLSAYNYTAPEFKDGISANIVKADTVNANSKDLVYNVYYGHQTQDVTTNKGVTRKFHYVFTDGTNPSDHLTPQADQTVNFTGTATKDLVTGTTGPTTWTPSTGTLAYVGPQPVNGYTITGHVNANADGSASAVNVDPTSSNIDVTLVYTPNAKPVETKQKAAVEIIDKNANKSLTSFNNNNGNKGDAISFDGEPQTLQAFLNTGYVFDSAVDANGSSIGASADNVNFGNFDSIDDNVQSFKIYLVHSTKTTTEKATTNAHVHSCSLCNCW